MNNISGRTTLLLVAILSGACATRQTVSRPALHSVAIERQASLTPAEQALVDQHCAEGAPRVLAKEAIGPTQLVIHNGYVLEHSSVNKIPLWVCEAVTRDQVSGNVPRTNPFRPDPQLAVGLRAELKDYKGSGFDRGHQAPAGDQTVDKTLKDETFFLSNMAPQVGALNQRAWAALEDLVRSWIADEKIENAKIVTGGFFFDPKEDDPARATGVIEIHTIGAGHVAVPTHFFKIVVAQFAGESQSRAIAFVMDNGAQKTPFDFAKDIVAIEWLEERTGLNFMPLLTGPEKDRLEHAPSPMWFQ
jgi:endonuclease G, mitochondrial